MYMPMAMPAMQVFQQDSWVVVPIHSVSRASHKMEGTRLTLVKVRSYWARTRMLLPGFGVPNHCLEPVRRWTARGLLLSRYVHTGRRWETLGDDTGK